MKPFLQLRNCSAMPAEAPRDALQKKPKKKTPR